ncbi:MAG: UDP-2,3-diacylglucosamine diphosphatase [Chitinophagales bacterium]
MQHLSGNKIYFLSDFHLGAPNQAASLEREKKLVRFLDEIKGHSKEIFIVGDLFDFWYEYRTVVPKGYTRILGKLAELTDSGIVIHFFVGNHDMWMKGYFEKELNIPVYFETRIFERHGKKLMIGHGDGLGPGDHRYKMLKKIFRNPVCQWLFGILPPAVGVGLANYFSRKSRAMTGLELSKFYGEDNEWLISYCKEVLKKEHIDFFIFGHRHLPIDFSLHADSRYINLGDWIHYYSYAVMNGGEISLTSLIPEMKEKIVKQ